MTTRAPLGVLDRPDAPTHPLEAPRPTDELYQAFPNRPVPYGINPADDLPVPMIPSSVKLAEQPPLDPDTIVCMADTTRFVIRDRWGDEVLSFVPYLVQRAPTGAYRVAIRLMPRSHWAAGHRWAAIGWAWRAFWTPDAWVAVEPLRPQCRHYARQLTDFPEDVEHQLQIRLCTIRRTDEGEFLSVANDRMHGCELREPRIGARLDRIEAFDDKIIEDQRLAKRDCEEFDVLGALGAQEGRKANGAAATGSG